ncbi:UNVERIFIED_ORG: hypothetical protein J2W85_005136, partial [Ensifer adhaerens]|nr:hypothetical protein [Ensifer adhaerens]
PRDPLRPQHQKLHGGNRTRSRRHLVVVSPDPSHVTAYAGIGFKLCGLGRWAPRPECRRSDKWPVKWFRVFVSPKHEVMATAKFGKYRARHIENSERFRIDCLIQSSSPGHRSRRLRAGSPTNKSKDDLRLQTFKIPLKRRCTIARSNDAQGNRPGLQGQSAGKSRATPPEPGFEEVPLQ